MYLLNQVNTKEKLRWQYQKRTSAQQLQNLVINFVVWLRCSIWKTKICILVTVDSLARVLANKQTHAGCVFEACLNGWKLFNIYTIVDNDMLSYSLTTMMCFLTKQWYGFPAYTVNLFIKAYHRITYKEDLKITWSAVSLRWYAFLCGFCSNMLFTIDHSRSISFFCQNAHHDWLTNDYISYWFLVIVSVGQFDTLVKACILSTFVETMTFCLKNWWGNGLLIFSSMPKSWCVCKHLFKWYKNIKLISGQNTKEYWKTCYHLGLKRPSANYHNFITVLIRVDFTYFHVGSMALTFLPFTKLYLKFLKYFAITVFNIFFSQFCTSILFVKT